MAYKKGYKIGFVICIIVFLVSMVWMARISLGFLIYEKTDASILDVSYHHSSSGKNIRNETRLKLSYTVNGETYRTSYTESGKTEYKVGEKKTVYYDPKNPEKVFAVPSPKGLVLPAIVMIGCAYCIIAGIINIKREKERKSKMQNNQ